MMLLRSWTFLEVCLDVDPVAQGFVNRVVDDLRSAVLPLASTRMPWLALA